MITDEEKLKQIDDAIRGDAAALTVLLTDFHDRWLPQLARRIPNSLRGLLAAEDVLQIAYAEVFSRIGGFEPRGADSFERWIATIAMRRLRNLVRDQRAARRGGGQPRLGSNAVGLQGSMIALLDMIEAAEHTPSRLAARREATAAVQAALCQLPQDYRDAIRLIYIEGKTVDAAAKTMGRTDRAIHNLCYKGKLRLRELLGSQHDF